MAENTAVNAQITDSTAPTNTLTNGDDPSILMASVYETMAHCLGLLKQNAVSFQQNMNMIGQATSSRGVVLIYSGEAIDPTTGKAVLPGTK